MLCVLVSLAIPSWRTFANNNRVTVDSHTLMSALRYARAQAVLTGKRTTLSIADHQVSVSNVKQRLRVFNPLDAASSVQWQGSGDAVSFMPSGSTAGQSGHYNYRVNGVLQRKIIVTMMGRTRVTQ